MPNPPAELDQLAAELYYSQAQTSLRQVIDTLDLTPREREGLQPEINISMVLQQILDKGN